MTYDSSRENYLGGFVVYRRTEYILCTSCTCRWRTRYPKLHGYPHQEICTGKWESFSRFEMWAFGDTYTEYTEDRINEIVEQWTMDTVLYLTSNLHCRRIMHRLKT